MSLKIFELYHQFGQEFMPKNGKPEFNEEVIQYCLNDANYTFDVHIGERHTNICRSLWIEDYCRARLSLNIGLIRGMWLSAHGEPFIKFYEKEKSRLLSLLTQ